MAIGIKVEMTDFDPFFETYGDDDLKNMAKAKMREQLSILAQADMGEDADVDRPAASTSVLRPNASVVHFTRAFSGAFQ
jgi:hypothetical protein